MFLLYLLEAKLPFNSLSVRPISLGIQYVIFSYIFIFLVLIKSNSLAMPFMIFGASLFINVVILVYRRLTPENSWKQVDFKMHCPNCLYRYYLLLIVMDHNLLFDHKRSSMENVDSKMQKRQFLKI